MYGPRICNFLNSSFLFLNLTVFLLFLFWSFLFPLLFDWLCLFSFLIDKFPLNIILVSNWYSHKTAEVKLSYPSNVPISMVGKGFLAASTVVQFLFIGLEFSFYLFEVAPASWQLDFLALYLLSPFYDIVLCSLQSPFNFLQLFSYNHPDVFVIEQIHDILVHQLTPFTLWFFVDQL